MQQLLQLGVGDDDFRRRVGGDVGDLVGAQAPIDRHQDRAQPRDRAIEIDKFEIVLRQHDHTVAALQARAGKAGRQPLDPRQILRMGDARVVEDEGGALRKKPRVALDDVEQREITQPHHAAP